MGTENCHSSSYYYYDYYYYYDDYDYKYIIIIDEVKLRVLRCWLTYLLGTC